MSAVFSQGDSPRQFAGNHFAGDPFVIGVDLPFYIPRPRCYGFARPRKYCRHNP
uniref:Uncharacterized protein n=1 Tax=Salmonella sp. 14 TaxID=1179812 RepID=I3W395_9ENTR|nr:hypothetical protein [Salmonella sp. 14]